MLLPQLLDSLGSQNISFGAKSKWFTEEFAKNDSGQQFSQLVQILQILDSLGETYKQEKLSIKGSDSPEGRKNIVTWLSGEWLLYSSYAGHDLRLNPFLGHWMEIWKQGLAPECVLFLIGLILSQTVNEVRMCVCSC